MRVVPPAIISYLTSHVPVKQPKAGSGAVAPLPRSSNAWTPHQAIIERFLTHLVHVVKKTSAGSDPKLLLFLLHQLDSVLPFVVCFGKIARVVLKVQHPDDYLVY